MITQPGESSPGHWDTYSPRLWVVESTAGAIRPGLTEGWYECLEYDKKTNVFTLLNGQAPQASTVTEEAAPGTHAVARAWEVAAEETLELTTIRDADTRREVAVPPHSPFWPTWTRPTVRPQAKQLCAAA